ncbi:DUF3108 domain-containing protein [Vulcaniibacterium tengchongense]|uniref:Uncharacterized protein DUF3108 n=1 Tax=Vulcaniibacterium tengchongense TaxID=1273429 RepID=A0A3N4VDE5_9GAMM|nr:DUF3108 domain-containing protein [Vulcaniibacterium tengchongense]RPE81026.1 uncharacterized protein DUF3108 [Vulcaniibacterium tengchongense]
MARQRSFPRLRVAAAAALLMLASAPALALKPFTADYQASYMGMQGNGRMTLAQADGNRWTYTLAVTSPLAELKQSTVFEDKGGQWRPLSGNDSSKVLTKRQNKTAAYDWSRGVASWSGDVKPDRAGPLPLQPGDLDALLVNLAIVRDVHAGKPLQYRMVEDGRVKQLRYEVAGKESISVGGKTVQATKVVGNQGDKQIIAWVVDGMPVPARILQRDNGQDAIDLRVTAVR